MLRRRLMNLLVIGAICIGCSSPTESVDKTPVYTTDNPKISIAVGGEFIIAVRENQSTGFEWRITEIDSGLVKLVSREHKQDSGSGTGIPGTTKFRFKTIQTGQSVLEMTHARFWDQGEIDKIVRFYLSVS